MRMKQISAASMQEAMNIARRELGEDAVLLETRKIAGNKGVTVVFAIDEDPDEHIAMEELADAPVYAASQVSGGRITRPQERAPQYTPPPEAPRPNLNLVASQSPVLELLDQVLNAHLVPAPLKEKLMQAARDVRVPKGEMLDAAETVLAESLNKILTFNPIRTGDKNYPQKALMLVGPHGAGKSATIAKLATQLKMAKKNVIIISTDVEHLGANDTLQTLSGILKCDFHVVEKRPALREMIREYQGKAWLLVDSAGVNIYEFQQMKALGELAGLQDVEPMLTCPAGTDAEEAQEMAGVFSFLPVERMLITRTDAARRFSSIFAVLSASNYSLANMTSSANPSDACNPLSAPALSRLMLRRLRERGTI